VTFTSSSTLGKVLRNSAAAEVFFAAAPEVRDAPNLELAKGLTLERLAGYINRDPLWLDELVRALAPLMDEQAHDQLVVPSADYEGDDVRPASASCTVPSTATRWGVTEISFAGPAHGNPFTDVELAATFRCGERSVVAHGFYDGDGTYRIRFMPDAEGLWAFRTRSNARSIDGIEGSFACGPPLPDAHGPVHVTDTFHFAHADGRRYLPIGTTCYAWTHQGDELERRTLDTLAASPFNKLRMCIFPKSYLYNENEPALHAFERREDGTFDLTRFDPEFFRHLEQRVTDLGRLGIEADLILFHPYDRWGYAELPPSVDDRYVRYVVARLAAFANVWWSLANEYDLMAEKELDDWERIGTLVRDRDPHGHLIGVHQCLDFYDNSKAWVTHSSVQRVDLYRTAENTTEWREQWGKPVVVDECAYEGDIDMTWGNISGEEMTRRCWEGAARGGYVGHGETYVDPDDVLWWSKGGELHGSSPSRIAFLRTILEDAPASLEPLPEMVMRSGHPTAGVRGQYVLQYLGFFQPRSRAFELPADEPYRFEVIDTWNMTIEEAGIQSGSCSVDLPGRPHMAIRITRVTDATARNSPATP
jgi:hypothetical protein